MKTISLERPKIRTVYATFRDKDGEESTVHVPAYGMTPKEAAAIYEQAIENAAGSTTEVA